MATLATARTNRVPLVVLVGQQDRRHLLAEPFLGRAAGRAWPGATRWRSSSRRGPRTCPGCLAQAWHAAALGLGPAIVIVPMGDWDEPAGDEPVPAPLTSRQAAGVAPSRRDRHRRTARPSESPVLVTGPGAATEAAWTALGDARGAAGLPRLPGDLLTARPGFPQDHPRFAGFLPAGRAALRAALAPHDAVLVAGAALLRQYHYEPGPLVEPGTRVAVISADPAEVQRSPADIGLVAARGRRGRRAGPRRFPGAAGPDASTCSAPPWPARSRAQRRPPRASPRRPCSPRWPRALPADAIVVEECPSSREALQLMLPARQPMGYLGLAMGGLGSACPPRSAFGWPGPAASWRDHRRRLGRLLLSGPCGRRPAGTSECPF